MCERQKCNSLHMNTFHTMNPIRYLRHRSHGHNGRDRRDWSYRCNGHGCDGCDRSHGCNGCDRRDWSHRRNRRNGCYGYGGYAAAVGIFHAKCARDGGQCVAV